MGSESQPLRNSGIYHNLPTFSLSIKNLTAIVTGANGISGFHTVRALLDSPQRWSKIYAMSRSPPPKVMMDLLTEEQRAKVQHVKSDFLEDSEVLAKAMKDAGVESVDCEFPYPARGLRWG
jgi:nucleoside-diphosphate-sugar epimerase